MKLPFNPVKVIGAKLFGNFNRPLFTYNEVVHGKTWACVDLGAFARPLQRLKEIEGVVIMEDRDPEFFLSFTHYDHWAPTGLNRHGPLRVWSTQHDLKDLVRELQDQKIKVAIGFWNYAGRGLGLLSKASWLRRHPEVWRTAKSSDLYPFVQLHEGVSYAEHIAHQYHKLRDAFGFDGLMLGDGMSGFRSFTDPDLYRDKEETVPEWTKFYEVIARTVHQSGGVLLAYDCMGYSYSEARRHGVDYRELSGAGLDYLVYQSYPQAWGEYWLSSFSDRFDLDSSVINLKSVTKALAGTETKVLYTLELGDSVEKWWARPIKTKRQIQRLNSLADGRFLVWGNDLLAELRP